jgi:DNA-binding NtrC family response regulator
MDHLSFINVRPDGKVPEQFQSTIQKDQFFQCQDMDSFSKISQAHYSKEGSIAVVLTSDQNLKVPQFIKEVEKLSLNIPVIVVGPYPEILNLSDSLLAGTISFLSDQANVALLQAMCEENLQKGTDLAKVCL